MHMLEGGLSWSGHEPNCCFLNTGTTRFANVSAVSGFSFPDDGRAVAVGDWDLDGRLDLWVTNRTAPRIRFLHNSVDTGHHFLAVRLEDNGITTNRDAIGARVEVVVSDEVSEVSDSPVPEDKPQQPSPGIQPSLHVKTLRAGEGFLAQSSKWLYFGLGGETSVERLVVGWPDGEVQQFDELEGDAHYEILQGNGKAQRWTFERPSVRLDHSQLVGPPVSDRAEILLTGPIPMPRLSYYDASGAQHSLTPVGKPRLVNLWSTTCKPCVAELREVAENQAQFEARGLGTLALCVDQSEDQAPAVALLERIGWQADSGFARPGLIKSLDQLQRGLLGRQRPLPVPASFLVDQQGQLVAIYKGPVDTSVVLEDFQRLGQTRSSFQPAALPFPGRWFDRPDMCYRNQLTLSQRLTEAGYPRLAMFYLHNLAGEQERFPGAQAVFAERFVDVGLALFEKGERSDGVKALERAVRLNPELPRAHYNLGMVQMSLGQAKKATNRFRKTLELDADYALAYFPLASVLEKQGELDEAISFFRRAVQEDPQHLQGHVQLAMALFQQRQIEKSLPHFRVATQIDPQNAVVHCNLGQALRLLGQHDEAVSSFKEAIRLQPALPQAHFQLAELLLERRQLDRAETCYLNAIGQQAGFTPAHFKLALLYMQAGRARKAKHYFRNVLRLDPGNLPVRNNLAWLMATHPEQRVREGAEALRLASEAVAITGGKDVTMLDTLAAAQAEQGQFEAAIQVVEQALVLAKSSGQPGQADQLSIRLKLYRKGQPYRDQSLTQ